MLARLPICAVCHFPLDRAELDESLSAVKDGGNMS